MAAATWSRIVSVFNEPNVPRVTANVGLDLLAAHEEVIRVRVGQQAHWTPIFEPAAFEREHEAIELEEWRLDAQALHAYGIRFSQVRRKLDGVRLQVEDEMQ